MAILDALVEWIFFDCFNTLLDDFDPAGDESGLCSLPVLAVELGVCSSHHEFIAACRAERAPLDVEHRERSFDLRLTRVVSALGRLTGPAASAAVVQLMLRWHAEYPA